MTRYAKRKLKYSLNENFNLLPYVEWDRFVTLTGVLSRRFGHSLYLISMDEDKLSVVVCTLVWIIRGFFLINHGNTHHIFIDWRRDD